MGAVINDRYMFVEKVFCILENKKKCKLRYHKKTLELFDRVLKFTNKISRDPKQKIYSYLNPSEWLMASGVLTHTLLDRDTEVAIQKDAKDRLEQLKIRQDPEESPKTQYLKALFKKAYQGADRERKNEIIDSMGCARPVLEIVFSKTQVVLIRTMRLVEKIFNNVWVKWGLTFFFAWHVAGFAVKVFHVIKTVAVGLLGITPVFNISAATIARCPLFVIKTATSLVKATDFVLRNQIQIILAGTALTIGSGYLSHRISRLSYRLAHAAALPTRVFLQVLVIPSCFLGFLLSFGLNGSIMNSLRIQARSMDTLRLTVEGEKAKFLWNEIMEKGIDLKHPLRG